MTHPGSVVLPTSERPFNPSRQQVASAALATNDDTGKHAGEADFFVGDYEGHRGASTRSKQLLQRVVTNCRAFDAVFSAAQSELQLAGR